MCNVWLVIGYIGEKFKRVICVKRFGMVSVDGNLGYGSE